MKNVKQHHNAFITVEGLPEDFETKRKERKRISDTLYDAIVADLQQLVDQDPGRSMSWMAR